MVSKSSIESGTPASRAMASKWSTALVEPPLAATPAMAFSMALRVTMARGLMPRRTASTTNWPQRKATPSLSGSTCGTAAVPIGERPISSITVAMVLAVYWPPQAPAPGQAEFSMASSSASVMRPAAFAPTASKTSWTVMSRPLWRPGRMVPPYRMRPGTSSRSSAMAAAGMVLSQPTRQRMPSNMWPRATSSMESAMTSRLTNEAFMPSVPMVTPSLMAMVLNSMGVPPAARTPSLAFTASSRRL